MCEAAIMTHDHRHPDPVKDARGCWKAGMFVQIMEDGFKWSPADYVNFLILKLPGIAKADIAKFELPQYSTLGDRTTAVTRRRQYKLDLAKVTPAVKTQLANAVTAGSTRVAALNAVSVDLSVK